MWKTFASNALTLIIVALFAAGALLALSGEGLQFASIVALTIAFGLSLDATIHYLNRLRLETRPGEEPAIGVKRVSMGSAFSSATYNALKSCAREVLENGTLGFLDR